MASMYGDDASAYAENAFIWSGLNKFLISGCKANASGFVKSGHVPLSSLMIDQSGQVSMSKFSIKDLVLNCQNVVKVGDVTSFACQSFMMNSNLPFTLNNSLSSAFVNEMQGEPVAFMIFERAFTNIFEGNDVKYTLNLLNQANFAYFPRLQSKFAQGMSSANGTDVLHHDLSTASQVDLLHAFSDTLRKKSVMSVQPHPLVGAPSWMYNRMPNVSKAWDWLENAYNKVKPWAGIAMQVG